MEKLLADAQEHANNTGDIVDVVDDDGELLAIVTPEEMVDNPCEKVIVRRENTRAGKPYLQRAAVCESTYRDYGFERGYKFLRYHEDHPKRTQELERQRKARQRDEAMRATRQEAASQKERAMVAVSPPPVPEHTPAPPASEYDTSELVGSPRQVAWAKKIRERFLASIDPALERAREDSSISHLIRDEVARMLETELRAEAKQAIATRWIDRYRDFPPTVRDLAARVKGIVRRHEGDLREIARQRVESERRERQRETEMLEVGGRTDFEERREARRERLEARAEKTRGEAEAAYKSSKDIASRIPFGEPIKVGHHSERRHRGDVAKIESYGRKASQAFKKTKELAARAAAVGSAGISQDDPEAIRKLRDELADAKEAHEKSKQLARAWRAAWLASRGSLSDRISATMNDPGVVAVGMPAESIREVARTVELQPFLGARPLDIAGMAARVRRIQQRIDELEKRAVAPSADVAYPDLGVVVRDMIEENRIGLVFDGKPNDETRRILKSHGFRWAPSMGAWVRYRNEAGRRAAAQVIKQLGS